MTAGDGVTVSIERLGPARDARGSVVELLAPDEIVAQRNVHVVWTEPGRVRGNHFHARGTEVMIVWGPALVRLREAGAKVTTHFYPGTHSPPYWERELRASLPALLAALGETGRS